jgi:glycine oxidase
MSCNGSLVVALGRDAVELKRFAQRTQRFIPADNELIASLEPDLAGRFHHGLFFAEEAHLDTRRALMQLLEHLKQLGGVVRFNINVDDDAHRSIAARCDYVIDCSGFAANISVDGLRGVKGEMLLLRSRDISLRRTIRLLHPRIPVYIVPRADHVFMVGATMIESEDTSSITARSMLELLSAAYALHPAFGEAEIIEIGTQVRPAFADNLPRIVKHDRMLYINGLYRHGFLVAPALARRATEAILHERTFPEVMHEDFGERRLA